MPTPRPGPHDQAKEPAQEFTFLPISADSESELLEAAVQHAVAVHKHQDTPDLRKMIKSAMKDGRPPISSHQLPEIAPLGDC